MLLLKHILKAQPDRSDPAVPLNKFSNIQNQLFRIGQPMLGRNRLLLGSPLQVGQSQANPPGSAAVQYQFLLSRPVRKVWIPSDLLRPHSVP